VGSVSAVWAKHSVNTSPAGTVTIAFDSEDFDTDGFHDLVTNTSRITIPSGKAGKYLVWCMDARNAFNRTQSGVKLNGAAASRTYAMSSEAGRVGCTWGFEIMDLAAGDFVEVESGGDGSPFTALASGKRFGVLQLDGITYFHPLGRVGFDKVRFAR
jgi:hypothetical protein